MTVRPISGHRFHRSHMSPIQDEIAAYEAIQARLEAEHMGEWILILGGRLKTGN